MKRYFILTLFFLCTCSLLQAAKIDIQHVHPLHWWVGMKNPELQILIHGKNVGSCTPTLSTTEVQIIRSETTSNPNYLILYVDTRKAQPQTFDIILRGKNLQKRIPYTLKTRTSRAVNSFTAADVVYLLMPDRFANGNLLNDKISSLLEPQVQRSNPDGRHGGDLAGIAQHLDYLADLGVTALWPTPVQINDQKSHTYHGYGITDYYQIDPRFGTNEEFYALVENCHQHGIKYIMDLVFNHCGSNNFLYADRPADDWFNFNSRYVQTNYKIATVSDIHAAKADKELAQDGWFVEPMPDFNQKNPAVMTYLIQTSLWWIEQAGIDGIRQDTYPYTDLEAMATWNQRIEQEYPSFNIVGETWINHNVGVSFWQKDSRLAAPRNSQLRSVMDFPLMYLLNSTVNEETDDWDHGFARLYEYLTQDRIYADPMNLLTFLDNHDTNRFQPNPEMAKNIDRYRQAITLLLTLRGIPQLYYGNEIGMSANKDKGDGELRQDFPGGFPDDAKNAFSPEGRNEQQTAYFDFTRKLLHWRKGNKAISEGSMTQFAPKEGIYAFSRQASDRSCLVIFNGTNQSKHISLTRFAESIPTPSAYEVLTEKTLPLTDSLYLAPRGIAIFDFKLGL